jgi:hypothetical protein
MEDRRLTGLKVEEIMKKAEKAKHALLKRVAKRA